MNGQWKAFTSGFMSLDDPVAWNARQRFRQESFILKIIAFLPPFYSRDGIQQGDFKKFVHEHFFEKNENGILMKDRVVPENSSGSWPQKFS